MKMGEIDIDNLFDSARHESPKIEFNEVKQDFINTVGNVNINSTIKHKLTIKNITIMLSTITLITAAIIAIPGHEKDNNTEAVENSTVTELGIIAVKSDENSPTVSSNVLVLNSDKKDELLVTNIGSKDEVTVENSSLDKKTKNSVIPVDFNLPNKGIVNEIQQVDNTVTATDTIKTDSVNAAPVLTLISHRISQSSTEEDLIKIQEDAIKYGVDINYTVIFKNDKIKKLDMQVQINKTNARDITDYIYIENGKKESFSLNVVWRIDDNNKAVDLNGKGRSLCR